jgi:LacI family transcriptional regulator
METFRNLLSFPLTGPQTLSIMPLDYRVRITVCATFALTAVVTLSARFEIGAGTPLSSQTTIRDVARELRVSHTTVSRVLNGKGDGIISEETRRRVVEAAARMNYRPHRAARALATGRTGMIALWVEDLSQAYAASVIKHVIGQVSDPSIEVVIRTMSRDRATQQNLAEWQVDGILALDGVDYVHHLLQSRTAFWPPLVAMGDPLGADVDHVGIDLYTGAVEAVNHLIEVGCRRIAFYTNGWGNRPGEYRYDGYTDAMKAAGLQTEYIVVRRVERSETRQVLREYVERAGCPEGLFCLSDTVAFCACRALRDAGYRIPDDVAVVGCDGLEEGEYLEYPLTTIVQPFEEMSATAWQILQQRIDDPAMPLQKRMLTPRLVVRSSSCRLPV